MRETITYLLRDRRARLSLLALILATAAMVFLLRDTGRFPLPGGEEPPSALDLRGQALSLEEVRALRDAHPGAVIRWDVPVGSGRFDSESQSIAVPDYTAADRAALDFFPALKELDASGSTDYEALQELRRDMPNLSVSWTVPVGDKTLPMDTPVLLLEGEETSAGELAETLSRFTALRRVVMDRCPYGDDERAELRRRFPGTLFQWPVELCSRTFLSTDETLSFAGQEDMTEADLRTIRKKAAEFPNLRAVDLTDCGFDGETLHALDEQLGDGVDVKWTFELYGVTVCTTDEEIDVSKRYIRDNAKAVEAAIPWMSHLKKVVMCEVEVSNKRLIELYEKYLPQGIRVVWMVQIKWGGIRTDSDHFTPYPESGARQYPSMTGLSNLYYCPDLVALDLGHSNIKDLGYLSIMPKLQYLILADSWVMDLTEVGELQELTWLEIFKTGVKDISPLLNCKKLEHLNICYIIAPGDHLYETLRQMTWLKRLWCCGTFMTKEQLAKLKEELPNCEIWDKMGDESVGSTWGYHPDYYAMRDALHMYYMSVDGNKCGRLSDEELAKIHKKYWGY